MSADLAESYDMDMQALAETLSRLKSELDMADEEVRRLRAEMVNVRAQLASARKDVKAVLGDPEQGVPLFVQLETTRGGKHWFVVAHPSMRRVICPCCARLVSVNTRDRGEVATGLTARVLRTHFATPETRIRKAAQVGLCEFGLIVRSL